MGVFFSQILTPDLEFIQARDQWNNDKQIKHLIRPHSNEKELTQLQFSTKDSLQEELESNALYFIKLDGELVGEMSFIIDPAQLIRRAPLSAWIGLVIGKAHARGQGIGARALAFLEQEIRRFNVPRIELGVFAFNTVAISLYQSMGYREFHRIDDFTYYDGQLWQDIRMEKWLSSNAHRDPMVDPSHNL